MRSFLPFTGPVGGEEAQAKVSKMILISKEPRKLVSIPLDHVLLDEMIFTLHSFLEDRERCVQSYTTDESVISTG